MNSGIVIILYKFEDDRIAETDFSIKIFWILRILREFFSSRGLIFACKNNFCPCSDLSFDFGD